MISDAFNTVRHYGQELRTRVSVCAVPGWQHAMLAVNVPGIDINLHMDVADLERLRDACTAVLEQLEAHESEEAA